MEPQHAALAARLDAILEKLAQARRQSGRDDEFGVARHRFRLNPPLPKADLDAFEERHGVRLPDDYRLFLLRAGDGGAGPYYGIEPLANWDQWLEDEAAEPGFLASPCPLVHGPTLVQAWRAAAERSARQTKGQGQPGTPPGIEWAEFLPGDFESWGHGTIHICDQGCTYSARLVVTGAARGRVVYFDAQGWRPPYFVADLTYFDWYERWLDTFLAGQPLFWFGMDNPEYG